MTAAADAADIAAHQQKTWFGHPRGLTILFLTEMWDQFSFFGMRALLVYYMTKELLISQPHSSLIYGLYSSFAYFTPLIGGIVSDKWLGRRRAVIIGGLVMAAGHFMMAFEPLFYVALATIVIGNGLFLPSLASQINQLYAPDDPRKASAYNIYYVGINVGAAISPFACGYLGETYGWHWGFVLAGVGMLIGLFTYLAGSKYLPKTNDFAQGEVAVKPSERRPGVAIYLVLLAVIAIVVIFRAAYEQGGNTIALWADTGVDRRVGHLSIPMTWFQSLNPLMIFLFTPFIVGYWTRRAQRGREPGSVTKMAIGGVVVAASYLLLTAVTAVDGTGRASWIWLVLFFVVYTAGELFILPVGLGLFGRLAPKGFAATAIAAWFMAAFFGNLLAGVVGTLWSTVSVAVFFAIVAGFAALSGLLLFLLSCWADRIEAEASHSAEQGDAIVGP
ncbi:MAG TPA: peptide MFS transporter [Rhizomicrobium sp.]